MWLFSREFSTTLVLEAKHREGAKAFKDVAALRDKREQQKRLGEERRKKNPIKDRLVLQVREKNGGCMCLNLEIL